MSTTIGLFHDCGAWTAHTQGVKLTLDDYCAYLTERNNPNDIYLSLDVINNGQKSYDNWLEMRKRGFNPIPIYHASTDLKYLKLYLDSGIDYLALGAIAKMHTGTRITSLDEMWRKFLVDRRGIPTIRVHGLGLTSLRVITRYPWYSVDSTSWQQAGMWGMLFLPRKTGGEFDCANHSYKRFVSTRAPRGQGEHHILDCSQEEQALAKEFVESCGVLWGISKLRPASRGAKLGENEIMWTKTRRGKPLPPTIEELVQKGVINDHMCRNIVNFKFFVRLSRQLPSYPWAFKPRIPKVLV